MESNGNFKNVIDVTPKKERNHGFKNHVVVPFLSGIIGCSVVIGTCFGVPSIKSKILRTSGTTTTTSSNLTNTTDASAGTVDFVSLANYSDTAVYASNKILPSIVGIEVTYNVKYKNGVEIERIEVSSKVIQEPVNKIVEIQTKIVTSRSGGRAISGSVAEYQAYAAEMCSTYGWSQTDFECLVSLWYKESRWNPNAYNSSSGAYGIPQALPGSKMASAGSDYQTNYKTQINWGLSYIKARYGTAKNTPPIIPDKTYLLSISYNP